MTDVIQRVYAFLKLPPNRFHAFMNSSDIFWTLNLHFEIKFKQVYLPCVGGNRKTFSRTKSKIPIAAKNVGLKTFLCWKCITLEICLTWKQFNHRTITPLSEFDYVTITTFTKLYKHSLFVTCFHTE